MIEQAQLPRLDVRKIEQEEDFNWKGPDVIIQAQPATAIYRNVHDAVVIRQESMTEDDDHFVFFATKSDVRTLINALKREIGEV
ncbi:MULTISPECIES: hypothetical protein [unclassified Rhizobium]|uniref:hypothetical protein n=1 Tax=unclassified Rhizobium TaxID=2613769 RepID=UPI0007E9CCE9|nr:MULTISPECIES: hypothetical protein [unclassified Rhizobium]ANM10378.1 hypothetical protein AMK05_CH01992 [Rhizobium sp. N324]ANM16863.1 hypothetical protein AMK06_CH01961 [Rhizobium sp. N541]ANM23248.1 hypothetical protein AMK07_CH01958 [Rhizobium sp. N941]